MGGAAGRLLRDGWAETAEVVDQCTTHFFVYPSYHSTAARSATPEFIVVSTTRAPGLFASPALLCCVFVLRNDWHTRELLFVANKGARISSLPARQFQTAVLVGTGTKAQRREIIRFEISFAQRCLPRWASCIGVPSPHERGRHSATDGVLRATPTNSVALRFEERTAVGSVS